MPASIDEIFGRAAAGLQAGNVDDAERSLRSILHERPGHEPSLNLLGLVLMRSGRFAEAEAMLQRAIEQGAASDITYYNYGILLQTLKRPADALKQFSQAIAINPTVAETWNNRGTVLNEVARYDEAVADFDRAIAIRPDYAAAYCNKGKSLAQLEQYDKALAVYDRALAINAALTEAWIGRGNVLSELHRYDDALAAYRRASEISPSLAEAWRGCGEACAGLGEFAQALAAYDRALELNPRLLRAWVGRGRVLVEFNRFEEAFTAYARAQAINPVSAAPALGRADMLFKLQKYDEAVHAYDQALTLEPDVAEAWVGIGQAWHFAGKNDRAFGALDRAFQLDPDFAYLEGLRLHTKMVLCDWTNFDAEVAHLLARIRAGKKASIPFTTLSVPSSAADQLLCAKSFIAGQPSLPALWRGEVYRHQRIRVAYVSSDLNDHVIGHLVVGLLESHDVSRLEVTALSTGPDPDTNARRRLKAASEHFLDVSSWNDERVAGFIRENEVDIVVDLNGHTTGARLGILSRRPAPLQVNFPYAGTSGAGYFDYIISDHTIIPPGHEQYYAEKVVRLPDAYLPNDALRIAPSYRPTRAECGLAESGFVFCCFNNAFKITPVIFDAWMRILQQVPDSILWMLEANTHVVSNLRQRARQCGISPDRLVFAPRVSFEDHLARHQLADLFLDTLFYNAHATASDALWMNVPIVTCLGTTFAGRVAASLLTAVGLRELITASLQDYEALATRLARDAGLLAGIREKLSRNRGTSALFDTERFARHIEAAYAEMHARHHNKQPPASFDLERLSQPSLLVGGDASVR